jgi:hypothetical protein
LQGAALAGARGLLEAPALAGAAEEWEEVVVALLAEPPMEKEKEKGTVDMAHSCGR